MSSSRTSPRRGFCPLAEAEFVAFLIGIKAVGTQPGDDRLPRRASMHTEHDSTAPAPNGGVGRDAAHSVGLVLALVIYAVLVSRSNFVIDDAYISFTYARNWAAGLGLVYNAGGEVVEGFSNPLWVAFLRLPAELDWPLGVVSRLVSVLCGALLIDMTGRALRRDLKLSPLATGLGLLALAAFPPFAVWCTGGLETAPFALLLFAAFRALCGRTVASQTSAGLLAGLFGIGIVWIRAEGLLWICALAASALAAHFADRRRRAGTPRRVLVFVGASLLGLVALLAWRQFTFGEWLPNTAHAKGALSSATLARGAKTTATFVLLFLTPLLAPFALFARTNDRRAHAFGAVTFLAAIALYNVLVGGDWMPMFRFFAPAAPFLALTLGLLADGPRRLQARILVSLGIILATLPLYGISVVPRAWLEPLYFRSFEVGYQSEWERHETSTRNLEAFTAIGQGLSEVSEPGDSLTAGAIGAIGYYSDELTIYDRNGLVDKDIARAAATGSDRSAGHDKRVPRAYFIDREPTFFDAVIIDGVAKQGSAEFQQAARALGQRIFSDPLERPLRERCTAEAYVLETGQTLLVLRRTGDPLEASAFWQSLGL